MTIAILDSGVDATHPDLAPNLVAGYNAYSNNLDTADVCGHGTAVAGSAAARSNNGTGVAGVAGQAKIMPIRIAYLDTNSNSCYAYASTIAAGITWPPTMAPVSPTSVTARWPATPPSRTPPST